MGREWDRGGGVNKFSKGKQGEKVEGHKGTAWKGKERNGIKKGRRAQRR